VLDSTRAAPDEITRKIEAAYHDPLPGTTVYIDPLRVAALPPGFVVTGGQRRVHHAVRTGQTLVEARLAVVAAPLSGAPIG